MLTSEYYVGVPTVVRREFGDVSQYRGLVYGKFMSTRRDLFLPVLPCREDGKLYFTLCAACAKEKSTDECAHTDEERAFVSIVTTEELALAIRKRYEVKELYEVWHYPEEQRDSRVFHEFESLWMRVKAEASGWPGSMADDPVSQAEYLTRYREKFNIELDPAKMRRNVPMRTVAKLCGNALYGRLGMRQDRTNVCVATEFDHLRRLLEDPNVDVHDVYIVNPTVSFVTYAFKKGTEQMEAVNLPMCIQTTSYARIMLYEAMDAIHSTAGCQLLYTDTDSVIFAGPQDFTPPFECGEVLGDLKDEIAGDYDQGAYISEFYCTGAKSYGYTVVTSSGPKTVMKLKGFRLDYNTSQVITPEVVKRMVLEENAQPVTVQYQRRVARSMKTGTMWERDEKKTYRLTADKRVLREDLDYATQPYGFDSTP